MRSRFWNVAAAALRPTRCGTGGRGIRWRSAWPSSPSLSPNRLLVAAVQRLSPTPRVSVGHRAALLQIRLLLSDVTSPVRGDGRGVGGPATRLAEHRQPTAVDRQRSRSACSSFTRSADLMAALRVSRSDR
jgi:hypothetical protein